MSAKKLSATLHRRGGITMSVEVPEPVPDAIARPSEVAALDKSAGAASGEFGERLFRRRSSDDGSLHYIQDHYLPEPSQGATTTSPTRCSACGRARSMFFIRSLPRTENLSAASPRLCDECYPKATQAEGRAEKAPTAH
jgi:hypothetical protein